MTIYLTLLFKAKDIAHLGMSGLIFLVIGSMLWDKREQFNFKSSVLAKAIGILLIVWVLFNLPLSPKKEELNFFLRGSPFIFALGLTIIAFGVQQIKQYWKELLILFFLGSPSVLLASINLSPITAKFSAFLLWCINFDVELEGVNIHLPQVTVEVYKGCSGIEAMTYLLAIAVIFLILFPLKQIYNFLIPIIAVTLAFVVNGFRVVLMTILVAADKQQAFKYWHEGEGSLIVGMIAIVIFIGFYFLLIRYSEIEN